MKATAAMSHRRLSLPSVMMVVALGLLGMVGAEFTNSFDDVVAGSTLAVAWDGIPQEAYPLAVTGQVIERTGDRDGANVNMFRVNVSFISTGNTFKWENAPYPLRYVPRGMYRLELRSTTWAGEGIAPLLAKSPTFNMRESKGTKTNGGGGGTAPTVIDYQSSGSPGINRPLAIGLGVAIGIPSVVALGIVSWCFRRKQRRAALEKRRRRHDFVIT
ncbi:hypothetical protein B0T18DRAFT_393766 [Schizothecium vesticola]|uniref:Uncharacterized protein n=1 Tax=Schizothecium vesticola TaxID=314040 RepID=A0AA40EKL0_9PEZI|nr:hypothetical protein B0T18DRAFT_393766 [Schizothecium vesticola]